MKTVEQDNNPGTADRRRNGLYLISALAALTLGILFLAAVPSLITAGLRPYSTNGWLSLLQDNWLILLFKLNAGFNGVQFDQLYGPNLLDIALMALVSVVYLGLSGTLRKTSRLWPMIAVVIPLLGIVLFIITRLAGRSGVMGAGIIISFVMLRSSTFSRGIALAGISANVLLLAGDFGTKTDSPSAVMAICMGIGYVLLLIWFFLIARSLFQLRQPTPIHIEA